MLCIKKLLTITLTAALLLVSGMTAVAAPVPDTGQTKYYNDTAEIPCPIAGEDFYGQDANYTINPMSYTTIDGTMVKDNVTGLMWELKNNKDGTKDYTNPHDADNIYTWYDSNTATNGGYAGTAGNDTDTEDFIKALNDAKFGGYTDWRLPTVKELVSIVDYSIAYPPGPTINTNYFKDTMSSWYFSSNTTYFLTYATSTYYYAWGINFNSGINDLVSKNNNCYVRAVRGTQVGSYDNFIVNVNGTVTDSSTGLMWQQNTSALTWKNALSYCENLNLGGYTDWRLPTIKELLSIVGYNSRIDTSIFKGQIGDNWSSTTLANRIGSAWTIQLMYGDFNDYDKDQYMCPVRAVRGGQAGSSGAFKLEVQTDSTDKRVGVPFDVSILAKDSNGNIDRTFSKIASLSSSTDSNSASSVKLSDGKWSGQFKVLYGGTGIYLNAASGSLSGKSNAFNVIGNVSTLSNIGGSIVDSYKQKITEQVKVEIGDAVSGVFSGGTYQFEGVPGGKSYTCKLTHLSSGKTSLTAPIFIPQGQSIVKDLKIILEADKAKTPVLLLAGIMGSSAQGQRWSRFPVLPSTQGQTGEDALQLHNPANAVGWKTLEKALQSDPSDRYLFFEVPYDWRMDIRDIVDTYLVPAIDRVKNLGYTKVSIVAHSMGGLVVRSYIQGDKYPQRQDIERFAMVGTPNAGSCSAYYMWEGGEPQLVDDMTDNPKANDFYFDTTAKNYKATFGKTIKSGDYPENTSEIWKYYVGKKNNQPLTAVKQLLPTYKFLGADESSERLLTVEKNDFLYELNEGKYFANALLRMGNQYDNSGKIKTIIFAGDGQNTIRRITDGFTCGIELYKDGNPEPRHSTKSAVMLTGSDSGDGTVLLNESALFPFNKGWASKQVGEGEHAELIEVFSNEIVKFIKGESVVPIKPKSKTVRTEEESSSYFAFSFSGRVQGYLTDSSGVGIGINPQTNLLENNVTDGEVIFLSDSGSISVNNPVNGTYKLDITSIYQEDYNLNISYGGSEADVSLDLHGFNYAGTQSLYITLNSFSANPVTVTMNPAVPTGLTANLANSTAGQSVTRLAWTSSTDSAVKSYKVYARLATDTYLSYLGSSTEASFLTNHTWAGNAEIPVWQYAVSAVKQDGTESFLSEIVENNDQDHDGLTDVEETEGGSLVNNPDSDGDGLDDSKEYGLGTSPIKADTDGDGYSDYAEVQAQSDPLNSSSVPVVQPQTYKILTDSSPSLNISSGENVKVYGSSGVNTLNISSGAKVECINFPGANVINIVQDSASDFTVYRSGATVYFESSAKGTTIKIPATKTTQTINFSGGVSYNLVVSNGKVMLGNQEVKTTVQPLG